MTKKINASDYSKLWFELSCILSPAVKREKHIDSRTGVDWTIIEQQVFGSALQIGCSFLERSSISTLDEHMKVIYQLRNAYVHNDFDLSKNRNKKALELCSTYNERETFKEIKGYNGNAFFELSESKAVFNESVFFYIRCILLSL